MAYIVGSASVEIVPDFRNAQNAITAFFAKQQNEIRVPVKPDMSPQATRDMEQQAAKTGERVGKAIAAGTEKQMEAHRQRELRAQERLGEAMARDVAKAAAKAIDEKKKLQEKADADALAAQQRLGAAMARDYERHLTERQRADAETLRAQQRLGAEMARDIERNAEARLQAQKRLGAEMARDIERERVARLRADEQSLQAQMRLGQQMAREMERQAADAGRARQQNFRDEERAFQEQLRSQIAAMKAAIRDAADDEKIRLQVEIDKQQAILDGRTTGGVVAQAIERELKQNAGLITAAVTGALTIGSGIISTASIGLFAGIGAAGAFQSQNLRDVWVETFTDIRDKGISDTAVLIPSFENMAVKIGSSFERMRPQLRNAFSDLGPQINIFTDSLTQMAENALPGFIGVIANGRPVISGFGNLIEDIGEGTTGLLDNLTEHAPAAGQSLSALGDGFGELLPLLGELMGEGAELGTIVLPALTAALSTAHWAVDLLGGSLPVLATGFLAFRSIQGAGRAINQLSQGMLNAAPNIGVWAQNLTGSSVAGERVMTATGRAAGGVAALGRAMPIAGIAIAAGAAIMADAKLEIDGFANAFIKGGAAAAKARDDLADEGAWTTIKTGIAGIFDGDMWSGASTAEIRLKNTREAVQELEGSMSPLELAQSRLAGWTETLAYRLTDESASAEDVAIAQRKVAEYTAASAREQEQLERGVRGVTEAMNDQADVARSRVDTEFGYQQSLIDTQEAAIKVSEAQTALNEARASGDNAAIIQAELDLKQAILDSSGALGAQVEAAKARAMSNLPATLDEEQRRFLGNKAALEELNAMMAMGITLPPSLEQYRQFLIGAMQDADGAKIAQGQLAAAIGEVGGAVSAVPDSKQVQITAPTEDLVTRLKDLGFTVEQVPGSKDILVSADTEEAKGNLGNLAGLLQDVDDIHVEPAVGLDPSQFNSQEDYVRAALEEIARQNPTPVVDANTNPLAEGLRLASGILGDVDRQRPTPVVDANADPLFTEAANARGVLNGVDGMRPNPLISARDNATPLALRVKAIIDGLRDKTITITTLQQGRIVAGGGVQPHTGGRIGELPVIKRSLGGKVEGPGTTTSDSVGPFLGDRANVWLSDKEWVIKASSSDLYGDAKMSAVNQGIAKILLPGDLGGFSGPSQDTGIRQMVSVSSGQSAAPARAATPPRAVSIYTPDVAYVARALKAQEHQDEVLASPWS